MRASFKINPAVFCATLQATLHAAIDSVDPRVAYDLYQACADRMALEIINRNLRKNGAPNV